MSGYAKLFSSILDSTIWLEPDHVRIVWVTMLAMADRNGRVEASVPGLAARARVSLEHASDAIERFLAPDKHSRTKDHDGRRIAEIDGGWMLVNYAKHRGAQSKESAKENAAARQRAYRDRKRIDREAAKRDVTSEPLRKHNERDAGDGGDAALQQPSRSSREASPPLRNHSAYPVDVDASASASASKGEGVQGERETRDVTLDDIPTRLDLAGRPIPRKGFPAMVPREEYSPSPGMLQWAADTLGLDEAAVETLTRDLLDKHGLRPHTRDWWDERWLRFAETAGASRERKRSAEPDDTINLDGVEVQS